MRHPLLTLALTCALMVPLMLRAPQVLAAPAAATAEQTTARVIVKFKADSPLLQRRGVMSANNRHVERAEVLGQRVGIALTSGAPVLDRAQVITAHGIDSAALAARLSHEADVEYAVVSQRRR